jgi:hypothetical protein
MFGAPAPRNGVACKSLFPVARNRALIQGLHMKTPVMQSQGIKVQGVGREAYRS